MPAPYRKACKFCAASKRRCDLALPRCSRCASRSIECLYDGGSVADSASARQRTASAVAEPSPKPGARPVDAASLAIQSVPSPASMDLSMGLQPSELLSFNATPDVQDLDWSNLMANMEDFVVPDLLTPHDTPDTSVLAGEIYQERIVYCVKQLKTFPAEFVETVHTSFVHGGLYRDHLPLALQDALGACALYGRRTAQNEAAVHRVLSETAGRLLGGWSSSSSSLGTSGVSGAPVSAPPLDQLAAAQALILLQIVRLFDGSVRLRAEAEQAETALAAMLKQLQVRTQYLSDESGKGTVSQLLTTGEPQGVWRSWLFAESLRRTLVMGYTVLGLYHFLKHGWDNCHHEFNTLSFYGQRRLWGAQSAYQWVRAAKEHAAFPLRFNSWTADATDLQPTDIDVLGLVMVVLMKGLDEGSEWTGQDLAAQLWRNDSSFLEQGQHARMTSGA